MSLLNFCLVVCHTGGPILIFWSSSNWRNSYCQNSCREGLSFPEDGNFYLPFTSIYSHYICVDSKVFCVAYHCFRHIQNVEGKIPSLLLSLSVLLSSRPPQDFLLLTPFRPCPPLPNSLLSSHSYMLFLECFYLRTTPNPKRIASSTIIDSAIWQSPPSPCSNYSVMITGLSCYKVIWERKGCTQKMEGRKRRRGKEKKKMNKRKWWKD